MIVAFASISSVNVVLLPEYVGQFENLRRQVERREPPEWVISFNDDYRDEELSGGPGDHSRNGGRKRGRSDNVQFA